MSQTTREEFLQLSRTRRVTPVIRRLFADSETPMGLYRKLARGPGSFLLESADQGGKWSRYSFLGVAVHGTLTGDDTGASWIDRGMGSDEAFGGPVPDSTLHAVASLHERWLSEPVPGLPPFAGGLVGHLGWDVVRELEHLPNRPAPTYGAPSVFLSLVKDAVAFDHHTSEVVIMALVHRHQAATGADYEEAVARIDAVHEALARPSSSTLHRRIDVDETPPPAGMSEDAFIQMVHRAGQHITDGDVFQVVLSQQFELPVRADALTVYRVLRQLNPSPYMYLLECEDLAGSVYHVVGSSPEALVSVHGRRVYSHPIAGSRPRGANPEADQALADDLRADAKERAEHLMLVDLARNDLSKVCEAGSVDVTEFMEVERFSHIMHLVSSVEGDLRAELTSVDVFRATFPAGTLSGAPKPRALEIIDALEHSARGVYGGVVGYFGHSGDADLAITIRTVWMSGGRAVVRAGAGIVADSDPQAEYQETIHKASAPTRAIRIANALEPDRS